MRGNPSHLLSTALYIPPIKLSTKALNSAESSKGTQLSGRLRRASFRHPAGGGAAPGGGDDDAGCSGSTTMTSSVPRSRSEETFSSGSDGVGEGASGMQVYPSRSRFVIEGRTRASKGLRARSAEGVGEGSGIAADFDDCESSHLAFNQKHPPANRLPVSYTCLKCLSEPEEDDAIRGLPFIYPPST